MAGKPIKMFQADFNIVGGSNMLPDAEILKIVTEIFEEFPDNGPFHIRVTRYILNFYI